MFFPLYEAVCSLKRAVGDRPQGVAGDCNSLAETHAWFDSRVAHHYPVFSFIFNDLNFGRDTGRNTLLPIVLFPAQQLHRRFYQFFTLYVLGIGMHFTGLS